MPFHIGLLLFPDITQLDMTGPYEVFIKFPDAKVHLIWKTREPVTAGGGMQIMPTMTFAECPQLDLICVPGGGVTAGIDFALRVAAEAFGPDLAKSIQLGIEYDPHPPFDSGSPESADPALVAKVRASASQRQSERQTAVDRAAARL
jgi:transcriptional regulator GlxA family with amidase domain